MKLDWNKIFYIFQIPLHWFREADRKLNIFGDGKLIRVERNNPDGTLITADPDAFGIPSSETGTATDGTDSPAVLDSNGASWTWEAGGDDGLMLDAYCKIAPQVSGSSYSVFQRCKLTFSKDGLLVSAQLLSDRIRIQARNA